MTLLSNLHIVGTNGAKNIHIDGDRIIAVTDHNGKSGGIRFSNAIAFPGLINSHDHLDFNLFPQLGNRIYDNYTAWGDDIHKNNRNEIDAVLKVPKILRTQWGLYKNLLAGVTTVVNHGEYLNIEDEFITVLQDQQSLHSVGFEKNWKWKLNNPVKKKQPCVIHAGEGTDEKAGQEIDSLIKANLLKKEMIAVHAVAMKQQQAASFKAVVWCPASNFFLLGKTAPVAELKNNTAIIFGTDSTLTASWNIWKHLRLAKKQNSLNDEELINTVTKNAASVWDLEQTGYIQPDFFADIVVAKEKASFFDLNPEDILLLMHHGNIRLFDESIKKDIVDAGVVLENFSRVIIGIQTKYIWGDIKGLIEKIKTCYPEAIFPVTV